jgi:hypothetical protein
LATSIQNDIIKENGEIDKASVAFAHLRDCRFASADQVRADFQANRISRDDAQKKLDILKSKFLEDIEIAEALGTKMGENMKEFQGASDQLLAQNTEAQGILADEKTRSQQAATTTTSKKSSKKSSVASTTCSKKSKKGCGSSATASTTPTAPKASTPAVAATVQVAKVTESGQVKHKAFSDQVSGAKAEAATKFSLEGNVSAVPSGNLYCAL